MVKAPEGCLGKLMGLFKKVLSNHNTKLMQLENPPNLTGYRVIERCEILSR